ncbi:MAG: hypothetical protein WCG29_12945, partial [Desulfomonile sp.]
HWGLAYLRGSGHHWGLAYLRGSGHHWGLAYRGRRSLIRPRSRRVDLKTGNIDALASRFIGKLL